MGAFKFRGELVGHTSDVRSLFCPRAGALLSSSRDMSIRSWNIDGPITSTTQSKLYAKHDNYVTTIVWAVPTEVFPNGLILTGSNDNLIRAFVEDEFDPVFVLHGHTDTVCSLDSNEKGIILSGSWDSSVRLWNYDSCICKLHRSGTTIWAVLFLPKSEAHPDEFRIATASSDSVIAIWHVPCALPLQPSLIYESATPARLLKGHTDCVRSLALLDTGRLLSASNDGSLRCWSLDSGACLAEFYGHTSFVYSVDVDPAHHFIVSSGEDRTVRVWSVPSIDANSVQQLECQQTLFMPCQTAWCVVFTKDGDIAVGCSDAKIRLFSSNPRRQASGSELAAYDSELASFQVTEGSLGDIDKHNLPGVEALAIPGRSEGQIMVIREDAAVVCYQWSMGESRWIKVGDVVGSAEPSDSGSNRLLFEGKEYDYVFTVDFDENMPAVKLPFNKTDDPWVVAQEFLHKHSLPQDYLDTVAKYIIKQANLDSSANSGVINQGVSDPFTGSVRYLPADKNDALLFPSKDFITLEAINIKLVLAKLKEFNIAAPMSLSDTTLRLVEQMNPQMSEEVAIRLTLSLLEPVGVWPRELAFPLFDLLRCLVRWHGASDAIFKLPAWTSILRNSGLKSVETAGLSQAELKCSLFVFRLMANVVATDFSRMEAELAVPASLPLVFEEAGRLVKLFDSPTALHFEKNKNVLVALATLAYNLATVAYRCSNEHSHIPNALPTLRGLPGLCVRLATSLLLFTAPKCAGSVTDYPPEVPLRLLIALATAVVSSVPAPPKDDSMSAEALAQLRLRRAYLVGSAATASSAPEESDAVLTGWERVRGVLCFWQQCKIAKPSTRMCASELLRLVE